jgi:hypothetical protein
MVRVTEPAGAGSGCGAGGVAAGSGGDAPPGAAVTAVGPSPLFRLSSRSTRAVRSSRRNGVTRTSSVSGRKQVPRRSCSVNVVRNSAGKFIISGRNRRVSTSFQPSAVGSFTSTTSRSGGV